MSTAEYFRQPQTRTGSLRSHVGKHEAAAWQQFQSLHLVLLSHSRQPQAAPDAQAAYTATLENVKQQRAAAAAEAGGGQQQQQQQALPPGVKVEEPHSLNVPGAKDGQYKFVKEQGGSVNAYSWSMQEWKWDLIGEVSGPPSGGGGDAGAIKKLHRGKEYDYVIDVDVADGAPPLKLALNRDDNPYLVADAFMAENDLPTTYKDQIVQFIMANTSIKQPGPSLDDIPITGGAFDPFTGGAPAPKPTFHHAPQSVYLVFDNLPPVDKLAAKVREFSAALQAEPSTSSSSLTAEESSQLEPMLQGAVAQATKAATATTAGGSGSGGEQLEPLVQLLVSKLLKWPLAQIFPILDIVRLMLLSEEGQHQLLSRHQCMDSLSTSTPGTVAAAMKAAADPNTAPPAAQQLGCRVAVNAFKQPEPRQWAVRERSGLLDTLAGAASSSNKAVRTSYATLLLNYVVASRQLKGELAQDEAKLQLLSGLAEVLSNCPTDDLDTLFRGLAATATLLIGDKALAALAGELGVKDVLRRVHDSPEAKSPQGRRVLEAALDVAAALEGKQ
ncbi:PLAA family ubiquitin binding-domain-containing protein [Dunaliella salina]|uniref:PLAA family ubiquitin binding-domain-containing protein n=1 Tax=Dunaliella salina TaxID=3046 RepID=A0ABQ7GYC7_DUNSA|nr:PLAA family ubiquitin binding-domain-containing protein [Dunaliella salina]|eukprot:KAF5839606.1 PLAA family ubiquitin binding-domain-containing protein [Dunaliella salina]